MTPLTGLGIWIWDLPQCEGGDLRAIAAKAKRCGISWVCVKAGEKSLDAQFTPALVAALRTEGIECAAWWYSHPSSVDSELAYLRVLVERCGVRHLVLDAEEPWEREPNDWSTVRDWRAQAAAFAARLREAVGPDVFLADAPWARPRSHGGPFPYAQFGAVMDARMPQFYWHLAAVEGEPYAHFVATADAQWAETAPGSLVCPIGSCVDAQGVRHAPVSELAAFLDRYADRAACSLWSWQHLNAAEWALLAQRARARANVDVTDGGRNEPVYAAPEPPTRDPHEGT